MNILKKNFLKENLSSEIRILKNSLIRASTMNPSISSKNVFASDIIGSLNSGLKIDNAKSFYKFQQNFFSSSR